MIPKTDKPVSIAIFGLFGGTNFGNEATLDATLLQISLRLPNARVFCISSPGTRSEIERVPLDPLQVTRLMWRLPASKFKSKLVNLLRLATEPWRYRRARRQLSGVTDLIVAGTGVIEDYEQGPLDLPTSVLRWTRAAKAVGARVEFLSVGVGPVIHPWSRRILRRACRLADYRSYRDEYSREYTKSLQFDAGNDPVVPDLAFGLEESRHFGPKHWPPRKIGIGVMGYVGWHQNSENSARIYRDYLLRIVSVVNWLIETGVQVELLIGDLPCDEPVTRDLRVLVDRPRDLESHSIATVGKLIERIQTTDLVIATRYHNQLLAIACGRPVIGLNYSQKGEALMIRAGLAEFSQSIEEFDVDRVKRSVQEISSMASPPTERLARCCAEARRSLDLQFDQLFGTKK